MSESKVLWKLPFPSSGLMDTHLVLLGGRECAIQLRDSPADPKPFQIVIVGYYAYKITTLDRLEYSSARQAYDQIVDLGITEWLQETNGILDKHEPMRNPQRKIKHLCFLPDDGPFYEFLCEGFRIDGERDERHT